MSTWQPEHPELAEYDPQVAPFFTGYRIDLEPREIARQEMLAATNLWHATAMSTQWEKPKEIDPRGWFDIHNQGAQGSCQGQSLADALEYVHVMAHGEEIQISRSFAYLASQEFDGLLGRDAGSTLQGGSKAAERGLPLESLFPYDVNYRSALNKYRSAKNDILNGPLFKLRGRVNLESYDACFNWLASWSGVIQIGIDWSVRLRNGWEIHEYRPGGGGGHAILLCGYLPIGGENWILLKNSHSTQWGKDGWAVVKPSAIDQMCRARWSSIVGRSDMVAPTVRPERIDNYRARIAA